MVVVAVTGGIGAGKSTVAGMLAARGAVVLDADRIARELVEPGTPGLAAVVERFGTGMLGPDGSLDRVALARVVFADDDARRDLEAITHPAVHAEIARLAAEAPSGSVVVCDVPLVDASAAGDVYDSVIVVEASPEARLRRLEERGMERADALARMDAQPSDEYRRAMATWVIVNDDDVHALDAQVERVWSQLQGSG